jgi:hypothetical protein
MSQRSLLPLSIVVVGAGLWWFGRKRLKGEQRFGVDSLFGVTFLALPFLIPTPPPPPPPPRQIRLLADQLLIGIPEDDSPCSDEPVLIWGAAPLQKFADEIGASAIETTALPENLRSAIVEQNPLQLYMFGHGLEWVYTCEKCQRFFTDPLHTGLNLDLVKDRYVQLLSCLTAQTLGPEIVKAGAKGCFGYNEPFELVLKVAPGSGRFVEAAVYGDIEIERALLEGERDLKNIYDRAIARYNNEIDYWGKHWAEESCDGALISEWEAQMLINVLIHNRDALRYYQPEVVPTS